MNNLISGWSWHWILNRSYKQIVLPLLLVGLARTFRFHKKARLREEDNNDESSPARHKTEYREKQTKNSVLLRNRKKCSPFLQSWELFDCFEKRRKMLEMKIRTWNQLARNLPFSFRFFLCRCKLLTLRMKKRRKKLDKLVLADNQFLLSHSRYRKKLKFFIVLNHWLVIQYVQFIKLTKAELFLWTHVFCFAPSGRGREKRQEISDCLIYRLIYTQKPHLC